MAKYIIKAFLIIVISITFITIGLTKYVGLPLVDIQKANAAFSSMRSIMGSAGVISGDVTAYSFPGAGDRLTTSHASAWDYGTADFTIDFWMRIDNTSDAVSPELFRHFEDSNNRWHLNYTPSTDIFRINNREGGSETIDNSWTSINLSIDTWYHIALVKDTGAFYLYLDGTQQGSSYANSVDLSYGTSTLTIMAVEVSATGWHLDEYRTSKTARWTSNFTPETLQYSSDANTELLIHCGETKSGTTGSGATFTDSGNIGHTITENGTAIEDTTTFKF